MAMQGTSPHPEVQVLLAKDALSDMLPKKVLDKIAGVTEEYMIDRLVTAIKVRFRNGFWSIALLLDDHKRMENHQSFKHAALNADDFIVNCCMIYEAGEYYGPS